MTLQFKQFLVGSVNDASQRGPLVNYVINNHAPLVLSQPAFEGVFKRYAVNKETATACELLYRCDRAVSLIVEHVCHSKDLFFNALKDEKYKAVVRPDEQYMYRTFTGMGPLVVMELDEKVLASSQRKAKFRIFDFLKRRKDYSERDFFAWLDKEAELMTRSKGLPTGVTKYVHNRVHEGSSLLQSLGMPCPEKAFDAVIETWTDSPAEVALLYPAMSARHARVVDPDLSASFLSEVVVVFEDPQRDPSRIHS